MLNRPVILAVRNKRQIVESSVSQRLQGRGRYEGTEKVHFKDGEHNVLDSYARCKKCGQGPPCTVQRLSVLRLPSSNFGSSIRTASSSAPTARDILRNVEGNRHAKNKIQGYGLLADDRPSSLPLDYSWNRFAGLVRTSAGLSAQWHITSHRRRVDLWSPKGNTVRAGFRSKTAANSQLVGSYLTWLNNGLTYLAKNWNPPPEFLDQDQELKKDFTEADLLNVLSGMPQLNRSALCRPSSINAIWTIIDARIYSQAFERPDSIVASELDLAVIRKILQQYLQT